MKLLPVWCGTVSHVSYVSIHFKQKKNEKNSSTTSNLLPLQKLQLHKCVVQWNCLNVCNLRREFRQKALESILCCFIHINEYSIVSGSKFAHILVCHVSRMLSIFVVCYFPLFVCVVFAELFGFFAQICKCGNRSLDVLNCTLFAVLIYIWNCLLSI